MARQVESRNEDSPIYNIWALMKKRCKPQGKNSLHYYYRGIGYSKDWESFANFQRDMEPTFKPGLTLERIDNNGDYCKENCRWATRKEQANNTRRNRLITIDGVTRTLAQWCDTVSVKPSTVRQRYYAYGWPIKKALGLE